MILDNFSSTSATSTSAFIILTPLIILSLGIFIGLAIVQIYLSKSKNKALGLIIPIIFCFLGFTVNAVISFLLGMAILAIRTFLIFLIPLQIPAIVYFIIYLVVRSSVPREDNTKREKELNKMNIQDL